MVVTCRQTPSTVYDIRPLTTAITDYAIGLEKLSDDDDDELMLNVLRCQLTY